MINFEQFHKDWRNLGMNNVINEYGRKELFDYLQQLDNVFGIKQRNNSFLYCTGVDGLDIMPYYISITYHIRGDSNKRYITTKSFADQCGYTMANEVQEKKVMELLETIIEDRKKRIEYQKTLDIQALVTEWFEYAKELLKDSKYTCKLKYGHSQCDKRDANAIVIYDEDGYQYSYLKIIVDEEFNDIRLDLCAIGCCHSEWYINTKSWKETIKDAINWLT